MRKTLVLTTAVALLAGLTAAKADSWGKPCTTAPESQWLSVEALKAKLEDQGYNVRRGFVKRACGEFYAVDKAGERVEIFVDPTNGTIIGKL